MTKKVSGIYLFGQHIIKDKHIYLVKVGYTENMASRLKTYHTHNPMVEYFDFKKLTVAHARIQEQKYHQWLSERYKLAPDAKEWFIVTEQFYKECKKKGFKSMSIPSNKKIISIPNRPLKTGDISNILTEAASPESLWINKTKPNRATNLQDHLLKNKNCDKEVHDKIAEYKTKNNNRILVPAAIFCQWMKEGKIRPADWFPAKNLVYILEGEENNTTAQLSSTVVTEPVTAPTIQDCDYQFSEDLPLKIIRQRKKEIQDKIQNCETELKHWQEILNTYIGI